jgi:SanA protein
MDYVLKIKRKIIYVFGGMALLALLLFGILFGADVVVTQSSQEIIYETTEEVPKRKVGLLLGTGKYAYGGRVNLFYQYRIDAAAALYEAGKIEFVLVSGDNGTVEYNEPEIMREDLIKRGIPEEKIVLDYAGFRTWDSVVRATEVFGEDNFIVITQKFHNERALFIAETQGINAIGFNAQEVPVSFSPKVWIRERLARVKVLLDVLFGSRPRFLGEMVVIE